MTAWDQEMDLQDVSSLRKEHIPEPEEPMSSNDG